MRNSKTLQMNMTCILVHPLHWCWRIEIQTSVWNETWNWSGGGKQNKKRSMTGRDGWSDYNEEKKNTGSDWWALILTNHLHNISNHFDVSQVQLIWCEIRSWQYFTLICMTERLRLTLNVHTLMRTETTNRRKHQKKPHVMMNRGLHLNTSKKKKKHLGTWLIRLWMC